MHLIILILHPRCDYRYSIGVQVPSLFQDNTASRVRLVNGVDKYVTESMLTKEEVDIVSGETIAKSKTKVKANSNAYGRLHSCSWKKMDRHWNTTIKRSKVFWSVKAVTRLLRHDQTVLRGIDEAIQPNDIIEECRKHEIDGASDRRRS